MARRAPQTNEVSRSNAILGGCLHIAARTKQPLDIHEIGSSAGLNLNFDRYHYDLGGREWGSADAAVKIVSPWEGEGNLPPLDAPLTVSSRQGCDLNPLDVSDESARERLLPLGKSRIRINGRDPIVHVSHYDNHQLILLFNEQQVSQLSFFFGIAPLALVLLVLYALAYFTYQQAKRALSPIQKLADSVRHYDINRANNPLDLEDLNWDADEETYILVDAINAFVERVQELLVRERTFSR